MKSTCLSRHMMRIHKNAIVVLTTVLCTVGNVTVAMEETIRNFSAELPEIYENGNETKNQKWNQNDLQKEIISAGHYFNNHSSTSNYLKSTAIQMKESVINNIFQEISSDLTYSNNTLVLSTGLNATDTSGGFGISENMYLPPKKKHGFVFEVKMTPNRDNEERNYLIDSHLLYGFSDMFFFQVGGLTLADNAEIDVGAIFRKFDNNTMIWGTNLFYSRPFGSRLAYNSIGAELATPNFLFTAGSYSSSISVFELEGADLSVTAIVPFFNQATVELGTFLEPYHSYLKMGVKWQPINAFSITANYYHLKNMSASISTELGLKWNFDRPIAEQITTISQRTMVEELKEAMVNRSTFFTRDKVPGGVVGGGVGGGGGTYGADQLRSFYPEKKCAYIGSYASAGRSVKVLSRDVSYANSAYKGHSLWCITPDGQIHNGDKQGSHQCTRMRGGTSSGMIAARKYRQIEGFDCADSVDHKLRFRYTDGAYRLKESASLGSDVYQKDAGTLCLINESGKMLALVDYPYAPVNDSYMMCSLRPLPTCDPSAISRCSCK